MRFLSTVTGAEESDAFTEADYWVRHVSQAVRFADGIAALEALSQAGPEAYLEVGPEPTLAKMGKRCASGPAASKEWPWLHSIEPGQAESTTVSSAFSQLQGALPALKYKRQPFPWRDAGPRLLRRRSEGPNEVLFDCPVRGDIFQAPSRA